MRNRSLDRSPKSLIWMALRWALTLPIALTLLAACGGGSGSDPVSSGLTNAAPTADAQSVELDEDSSVDIVLTGSDPDGEVVSYNVTEQPQHGSLSGSAPELTYTPDANFDESDSFEFSVTDNEGAVSSEATVSITVHPVNDPPTAEPQAFAISEDESLVFSLIADDIDDGILAYKITRWPSHAWLVGEAPGLEFFPDRDFSGTDRLEFYVEDTEGATSDTVSVTFSVDPVNDVPIFEDEHFRVPTSGHLSGVELQANDVDGEISGIVIVSLPQHGVAGIAGIVLSYEPDQGFEGEDQMTVFAEDDDGTHSRTATLHFSVAPRSVERDREMLADFFEDTGGAEGWIQSEGWGTDDPMHLWFGLWTWKGGYAGRISLRENNVTGEIPADFVHLGANIDFRFDDNSLSGPIPDELTAIPDMRTFEFSDNNLDGPIPWHIGKHRTLSYLRLSDNQLTGSIPRTVARMETLKEFYVGGNELVGRVWVEDLPRSLEELSLRQNNLSGPVPKGLGEFTKLRILYLNDSGLTGRLPMELMNLQRLEDFAFVGDSGELCSPGDPDFQAWLAAIPEHDVGTCEVPPTIALFEENRVGHLTTGITTHASTGVINNEGDSDLVVTITTSDSWLTVSQSSFAVSPFRSLEFDIFVDCGSEERRTGAVTISTNDPDRPTRTIEIDVECLVRDLAIEFDSEPVAATGSPDAKTVSGTLEWRMTSSTSDDRGEPFSLTMSASDPSVVRPQAGQEISGTAVPEAMNTHELFADCRFGGAANIDVTVEIGSLSEVSEWSLQCEADVYRVTEVNWYQGPFVARQTFVYDGLATEPASTSLEKNTPVLRDRRAVTSFLVAHGYDTAAELQGAWWTNGPNLVTLDEATERTYAAVDDSVLEYGDAFTFHLPGQYMSDQEGEATLLFQTDGMEDPLTLRLSELDLDSVHSFNPVVVPYIVDPEDGSDPEPAPNFDMDDMLEETRDWLPIANDNPVERESVFVPLSEIREAEDAEAYVLGLAASLYNEEGEEDEFYHAVLFDGVNDFPCGGGIAYVGWQVGVSCVEVDPETGSLDEGGDIVAHEFGHNFHLWHTPCGLSSYDPDYPYPNAQMGPEPGWSYPLDRFITSADGYVSYMSYCEPPFVSDFDYREAAEWFLHLTGEWGAEDAQPRADERPGQLYRSIALMGRLDVESGEWELLQSQYSTRPPRQPREGPWELVLFDRIGVELYREPMRLYERQRRDEHEEPRQVLTWFARVPVPPQVPAELRIIDPDGIEAFSSAIEVTPSKQR